LKRKKNDEKRKKIDEKMLLKFLNRGFSTKIISLICNEKTNKSFDRVTKESEIKIIH
jgi:hypothetical protein